ncbi:MAG: hypothetical protein JSS75_12415 [Bacteroidetes bacterium]|nr:hypothetical protein [Bacteroidota bacterium]
MKRITLLSAKLAAVVAVVGLAGVVSAQVPSLVTQQLRLSTGGTTPNYVQLRAITGAGASTNFYQLDQAPTPTAGQNYSLWLNDQNQIVRSDAFGPAQSHFLLQVNTAGNGLQWVDPSVLTTLDGDIKGPVDSTLVNVGHSGLNNRLIQGINDATGYDNVSLLHIDRGGTNSNAVPTAGAVAYGDGTAYQFTAVGTNRQVLTSTGITAPVWRDMLGGMFDVNNGLTRVGDSLIQWGGTLIKNTSIDQAGFNVAFTSGSNANFNLGNGSAQFNVSVDVGTGGNLNIKNLTATTDTTLLIIDGTGNVHTRALTSLVSADNGLTITSNNVVELGSGATGGAPLLGNRFVSLSGHDLTFEGAGNFSIGDGTNSQNITLDHGATGQLTLKSLTATTDTTILITDGTGNVHTRSMNSLVSADNGLIVNNISGTSTVELGSAATAGANLTRNSFVTLAGHDLNFDGSGNVNIGSAAGVQNITIDHGTGGQLTLKSLTATTDTTLVIVDGSGNVHTRALSSLVSADNGLTITSNNVVELGSAATGGALLLGDRFVNLSTHALNFEGSGSFNVGGGAAVQNITLDHGTGGNLTFKSLTASTDTTILITDENGNVHTRSMNNLVGARNGLLLTNVAGTPTVELGSAATGGANLLRNSFVTLNGNALNFDGAGSFNIGDGTSVQNVKIDPGVTGTVVINNLTTTTDTTMLILDATNHVHVRALSSLVNADNGLTVANGNTVELGSSATGGAPILGDRFVSMNGHNLNFEGTSGNVNLGNSTSNVNTNVNTGTTGNLNIQGSTFNAATGINNFMWADSATGNVRMTRTNQLSRDDNPALYLTLDAAGNVIKSIGNNNTLKGHVAWTNYIQTITLPAGQTITSGASITVSIENHASAGTVAVQVTNVGSNSFDIEASDNPVGATSFINYVIINP